MLKIKQLVDEDFINYKKPCMFMSFPTCNWKCEKDCGQRVCQNSALALSPDILVDEDEIVNRYMSNPITTSVVLSGLEPFDSWEDLFILINKFRDKTNDDIVIYTGYNKEEISEKIEILKNIQNIIVKFGRYIPDSTPVFDEVLGVTLASDNQHAEHISIKE